jgi:hypothetical protein
MGRKSILHRTDPRKSINWKAILSKRKKGKKKKKKQNKSLVGYLNIHIQM